MGNELAWKSGHSFKILAKIGQWLVDQRPLDPVLLLIDQMSFEEDLLVQQFAKMWPADHRQEPVELQ